MTCPIMFEDIRTNGQTAVRFLLYFCKHKDKCIGVCWVVDVLLQQNSMTYLYMNYLYAL